jgi:hypothetical protein
VYGFDGDRVAAGRLLNFSQTEGMGEIEKNNQGE